MDVDDRSSIFTGALGQRISVDTLFANSDELTVSFYANLPVELKQELKNADFFKDAFTGDIDTVTGFALVASVQTCFVWQHAQAIKGIPTCYIFSCPQDQNEVSSHPFHSLVPFSSSREPGLILISLRGQIRFWDSIGIGLAGGDHYITAHLRLSEDEHVTNLLRSNTQTYIVSTSSGNLFRLILTSTGGKHHLTHHAFSRPSHSLSFSRLIPSIFSSGDAVDISSGLSSNISAVALGTQNPSGGREVWALVDTHIQKWDMKSEGWEEIRMNVNVAPLLTLALREAYGSSLDADDQKIDLELLDLAIDTDGLLVVLLSYAGKEDESSMAVDLSGVRRIYTLAHLLCFGDSFKVESVRSVPYQSTSASGSPMHARIRLLMGGPVVSVQFGDAVALCARDSDYRDRLELKSTTDRTLGVGVAASDNTLLVLTAGTMMKVSVDMEKISTFDSEVGRARLIKAIMMQAILFSFPENPLHFSFPPEVDEESLMQGAEQLSQAVLESDPEVVRKNHDLTAQLTERKERLSWLIRFINDNAVLVKMSQRSRQQLATDAEKLYACHQLWMKHNQLLTLNPTHSVLNDVVHSYMQEIGEGYHEDIMRAFFRYRAGDIGRVLRRVLEMTVQACQHTGKAMIELLPEANRIVLTVLMSAFDYREYNLGIYGIDLPMIKPWSSRPAIIDVVLGLFDATTKAVESPDPRAAHSVSSNESNAQLPDLAVILFMCIQERLDWLTSIAASDPGAERDRDELEKKFALLRPEVLETLRKNGHDEAAFTLAERFHDFSSLTALCHTNKVYPPEDNPNYMRIQTYLDRFKDSFSTELYDWYIQHGELRCMFAQEDTQSAYIDKYFTDKPSPAISWIFDLGKGRHGLAAETLLGEAEKAKNLESKHLMLSIGKLSQLAQLHEANGTVDERMLDVFHDDLDFISVHGSLVDEFKSTLQSVHGRQSLENQIDIILKAKGSQLSERRALEQIFKGHIRDLLQGKALCIEDAVDVLTLKDNTTTPEDFATALHLLGRVENLPDIRKVSAFRTVWRRIYIHDDWDAIRKTANISDAELNDRFRNTALYNVLCAILHRGLQLDQHEILPDVALMTPSPTEIASRWPGLSPDQVEEIVQDYNIECDRLGDMDLNDVYHRVRELAMQDVSFDE